MNAREDLIQAFRAFLEVHELEAFQCDFKDLYRVCFQQFDAALVDGEIVPGKNRMELIGDLALLHEVEFFCDRLRDWIISVREVFCQFDYDNMRGLEVTDNLREIFGDELCNGHSDIRLQARRIVEAIERTELSIKEVDIVAEEFIGEPMLMKIYLLLRQNKGKDTTITQIEDYLENNVLRPTVKRYINRIDTRLHHHGMEVYSERNSNKYRLKSISDKLV
jgi:hypothetical protein